MKLDSDSTSKKFAGYQSNFKKLSKMISEMDCEHSDWLRSEMLKKIGASEIAIMEIERNINQPKTTKHYFINELEKFVWIIN